MGTYGVTAIKSEDKIIFLTDSHDGYFSGMGKNNFIGAAISPPSKLLKQLLSQFDNKSYEWSTVSDRDRQKAIYQYTKDGGLDKDRFESYLMGELRPSIGGFLPTLYCGVHTGYSDTDNYADYLVNLDTDEISYIKECSKEENGQITFFPYFTISIQKLREAGTKRVNFFGEHFEEVLDNMNESAESITLSKLNSIDENGDTSQQEILSNTDEYDEYQLESTNTANDGESFFDLLEEAEGDTEATTKLQTLIQQKIEEFLSLDEKVINEILRREKLYHEKTIIEIEKRNADFQQSLLGDKFKEDKPSFYSISSGEVSFDQKILFIHLFQNLVLNNSNINPEVALRKVQWWEEVCEDNTFKHFVSIKQDFEDPNYVLKEFSDTLWHDFDFKLNITSSTGGIGIFDTNIEEKEELPILVTKSEFSSRSPEHWGALNDNLPNVALYVPYAEMREITLSEDYLAPGPFIYQPMLKFAILNRDIETSGKLLSLLQKDFEEKSTDPNLATLEENITKFLMRSLAQSKSIYEKTNNISIANYQSNFEDFICGVSNKLSTFQNNMLDFEKDLYLNKGTSGSKAKLKH